MDVDRHCAEKAQGWRAQAQDLTADEVKAFLKLITDQDVTLTISRAADLLMAVIRDAGVQGDGVAHTDFSGLFWCAAGVAHLPGVMDDQSRLRTLQDHAPHFHRALVRWNPVERFTQQIEGFSSLREGRTVQVTLVSSHHDDVFAIWDVRNVDEANTAVVVHVYRTAEGRRMNWRVAGSRKSPPDTQKSYRIR